jgi:hypothetical protein
MSVHPAHIRAPATPAAKPRWLDRLFVGGCTAAYAVLIAAVLLALKAYGG